ncbi:MAG: type I glyceraldehyde-3-phosphate dehydrogenase [Planctomycetota bacterium]
MRIMINGFGRIGRAALKIALDQGVAVVRINDIVDATTLAYLLKYDTVYGVYPHDVQAGDGELRVGGTSIPISNLKDPALLPHKDDKVDVVLEATGIFLTREDARKHLDAGAKKVLITAPAKSPVDGNFIVGVNEDQYDGDKHAVITIGSCTTNCVVPMAKVIHDAFTIVHGSMTTVHAYTSTQALVDVPAKKPERGRAAAENIVPTTTGAAKMIGKIITDLEGKVDGMALRVPIPCGSITDMTCQVEQPTSAEEVNKAFQDYARGCGTGVLTIATDPLVSHDIVGNPSSCVLAAEHTNVVDDKLVKVLGWYDNEWGFSTRLIDMAKRMV